ncbi:MAG: hypothetical protein AB8G17_00535 [Gammaproteobacteria bacterium]
MCKLLIHLAFGQGSGQRHSVLARVINAFALACALITSGVAQAQQCGIPGNDGPAALSGIVNTYWPGTTNPGAGTSSLTLGSARGASATISAGDLVLVIQMQDANINRDNTSSYGDGAGGDPASGSTNLRRSGRFEFARATNAVGLGGGTLTLASPTQFDYSTQSATGTRGQRGFQVVRVPQFSNLTLTGTLTATVWNGSSGGVVALDIADTLDLNGQRIDVSASGFRGGGGRSSTTGSGASTDYRTPFSNGANGAKGEGIAGSPRLMFDNGSVIDNLVEGYPNGSFARGAPGNAGGGGTDGNPSSNDQNTGGGGGAGFGDGGVGGYAWCPGGPSVCAQTGGFGGAGVTSMSVDRLVPGGGGGAGTTNNATGTPAGGPASSGARGGGVVIVRAATVVGNGEILADGETANQTVGNDGSGGGGGGGAVLLAAADASGASVTVRVRGGDGGTNGNSSPHGPGGGGGGGLAALNAALSATSTSVLGGAPGTTDGNPAPFTSNYGATAGSSGQRISISELDIPGVSSGFECSEPLVATKTASVISDPIVGTGNAHALPGAVVEYTIAITNPGAASIDSGTVTLTDVLPDNTSFINDPLTGGLSVRFVDDSPASGLTLVASDLAFSNTGGSTYLYAPSSGADAAVDAIRITPGGAMAAGSTVEFRFRVEIE